MGPTPTTAAIVRSYVRYRAERKRRAARRASGVTRSEAWKTQIGAARSKMAVCGMADDPLPLAAEFPPADEARWRKAVESALKGGDFDKRLVSRTYDGLRIAPLYPRTAHGKAVIARAKPWTIMA